MDILLLKEKIDDIDMILSNKKYVNKYKMSIISRFAVMKKAA